MNLNRYASLLVDEKTAAHVKQKQIIRYENGVSNEFAQYFAQYKIDRGTLERFNVRQVAKHSFFSKAGKLCNFGYKRQNKIVVCYCIDDRIKPYIPEIPGKQEKSFGFKDQSVADISGLHKLAPCKTLYLSAGEKDCLALKSNGLPSVCFQSENVFPTDSQIKQLKSFT